MDKKGNYRADKSLGQHFLVNRHIRSRIVECLNPQENDNILEIGPGQGALSEILKFSPHKNLLAVERDRRFVPMLASIFAPGELAIMDALTFDWQKLRESWKLIGNLPYNIASPLIWDILSKCDRLSRAVFMVQQEVGERIVAQPGSRHYGALSVWCQCHALPQLEIKVSPGNFSPPPKVWSAVLSFQPLPLNKKPQYPKVLDFLLKVLFQQRRKQIGTILRKNNLPVLTEIIKEMGIDPALRPETLSPEQFMEISDRFVKFKEN